MDNEGAMLLLDRLDGIRSSIRRILLLRGIAMVGVSILITLPVLILIDWFLRMSVPVRTLLLISLLTSITWVVVTQLISRLRFNPSRTDVAHRIGRLVPGDDGRIASATQFLDRTGSDGPVPESCIEHAEQAVDSITEHGLLRTGTTRVWIACAALAGITCLVIALIDPVSTGIGLRRMLLPGSSAQWPARTAVTSLMEVGDGFVHGRGTALLMRARNDTVDDPSGPITLRFREHDGGDSTDWSSILLTDQGDGVHERVLTPTGDLIEFSFASADAETPIESIRILPLPDIIEARAEITPPEYMVSAGADPVLHAGDDGSPLRIPEPVLEGSFLSIDLRSNNTIDIPTDPESSRAWLHDVIGVEPPDGMTVSPSIGDPTGFTIETVIRNSTRHVLLLRDIHGLKAVEPWSISLDSMRDREPSVAFESPEQDLSLLASAVLPINLSSSDDLQVDHVLIQATMESGVEASGSSETVWSIEENPASSSHTLSTRIDFTELGLGSGTTILLEGMVSDNFRDEHGAARTVQAAPRRISIVDESTFLSRIRDRFKLLQQRVKELDATQERLQRITRSGSWTTQEQREQAGLSRSIVEQAEMLDSIRNDMDMNRAVDQRIESLLNRSSESMEQAAGASARAVESMQDLDRDRTLEMQDEVRMELGELVSMLGEDEESWLVGRRIEQLIEQQQDLLERSGSLGEELLGVQRESMDADQMSTLDSLAREQLALSESAKELEESLRERADVMEDADPELAEAMDRASEDARRNRLAERMEEASEELSEGRMRNAAGAQQSALESLRRMRDELDPDPGVDVEELVRLLEELQESIERLARIQRRELNRLDAAIEQERFTNLDIQMMRLRTSTLSVASRARLGGDASSSITGTLEDAAGRQADAVSALRSDPISPLLARSEEEQSLELLESALRESMELAEEARDRMDSGVRNELAMQYRSLAERESIVIERTRTTANGESDRRARFELRRVGGEQEEIRLSLTDLMDSNEALNGSTAFEHAHGRIDTLCEKIIEDLRSGRVTDLTIHREQMVMKRLLDLADSIEQENAQDRFAESQGGSGSGSGGGSEDPSGASDDLIPPIAEVRLLRNLQIGLLEETRSIEQDAGRFGSDQARMLEELAIEQESLARLGVRMLEALQERQKDAAPVEQSDGGPIPPPSMQPIEETSSDGTDSDDDGLADLDELLGLESDDEPGPDADPIDVPDDAPEGLTPLVNAIQGMHEAARRLEIDSTGVRTQRIQQEVIDELDRLIELAEQQQQQQQQSPDSENSESSPGSMQQNQNSSPGPATETGEGQPVMDGLDADPGELIDEQGTEWGRLPDRVRKMLQQGRQDAYSSLYERMTIEYYRRLAREARDD